jgi:hypothetical protein
MITSIRRDLQNGKALLLAPADFAEIKHVPLHHVSASHALVFDAAPIPVLFGCGRKSVDS